MADSSGDELIEGSAAIRRRIEGIRYRIQNAVANYDSLTAGSQKVALNEAISQLRSRLPFLQSVTDVAAQNTDFMMAYKLQHEIELLKKCVDEDDSLDAGPGMPVPSQTFSPLRARAQLPDEIGEARRSIGGADRSHARFSNTGMPAPHQTSSPGRVHRLQKRVAVDYNAPRTPSQFNSLYGSLQV